MMKIDTLAPHSEWKYIRSNVSLFYRVALATLLHSWCLVVGSRDFSDSCDLWTCHCHLMFNVYEILTPSCHKEVCGWWLRSNPDSFPLFRDLIFNSNSLWHSRTTFVFRRKPGNSNPCLDGADKWHENKITTMNTKCIFSKLSIISIHQVAPKYHFYTTV